MGSVEKTICLGDEYDDRLRQTLMVVLREMGALMDERILGVGGSQELETVQAAIGRQTLVIEAETYVGLSVTGQDRLPNSERPVKACD